MISQPAVSKSIKSLEEQLGGVLFIRTKRGVILTEEGKEFYKYIKQAIEQINNAENKFTNLVNLETGTIRIGAGTTLTRQVLLPYLELFHKKYPKIKIEISTSVSSELINKLQRGELDLVLLNLPYKANNEIEIKELKDLHDVFIVGASYKHLINKKLLLKDLKNYPLISLVRGSTTRNYFEEYLRENNAILEPEMNLTSFTLVIDFVKIGLGIGYSTKEFIEESLAKKDVYILDVSPKIPSRKVGIAYSKKNLPSFCTRKLIDIILKK